MTQFPLYENLIKDISDDITALNKQQKEQLISKIKSLDEHGHELIYVLIKVHYNNENENSYSLPYKIKSLKLGLRIDINQLPIKLQHIINNFVQLHLNST